MKLPSTYRIVGRNLPRLDLPAKLAGAAFIHDIAPENVVHARVLRQPWRGARLVALDEAAVRRAAKAPIEILREGDFVAFTAESEIAVMRAAEAARALARWDGGEPAPAGIGEPDWLKAQPARDRTVETGLAGRADAGRGLVEARYSRPFLTYASIGPSCALARISRTARSRCGRTARARPCCATGSRGRSAFERSQVTVLPPPGRRRLRPQHRRRCRLRRRLHRHPDAGADRARAVVARGRVRLRADQHRHGDRAVAPCSTPTTGRPTGPSRSGARRTPSAPA